MISVSVVSVPLSRAHLTIIIMMIMMRFFYEYDDEFGDDFDDDDAFLSEDDASWNVPQSKLYLYCQL